MATYSSIRFGACASTLLFTAAAAYADSLDLGNPADSQVIATAVLFDRVKASCAATDGMTAALRSETSAWESANHIERVRAEVSRLASEPATSATMQSVDRMVDAILASTKGQSCSGLQRLVSNPSTSIAARAAQLTAAAPSAPSAPSAAQSTAPKVAAAKTGDIGRIAEQIEGFAFDTRAGIGAGGMVSIVVYPVVLFKNGQALTDVEGLGFAGGPDAHRLASPADWTRWQRADGKIQTMKKGAWTDLPFNVIYRRVPAKFSLTGRYQRTGGAGNIAMGGTDAVTTWETYDFFPGGRVIKGGGAGAQASGGDFSTVARSMAANRRGRYSIDGLTLQLTYDDGSSESAIFVTDPQNPSVIWLNGRDFRHLRSK